MKRYIFTILTAAFLAVSCENTVEEIWSNDNEAILVLNAQLWQDRTLHRIFVHCSEGSHSNEVKDADVTLTVNGGAPQKALPWNYTEEGFNGYMIEEFRGYNVDADLAPGDKVEVRASWHGLSASASIEVPEVCGTISKVDTAYIVVPGGGSDGRDWHSRQYAITVKDKAGEKNYYMLSFEDIFYRINPYGVKVDSFASEGSFDSTADPLLHPAESSLLEDYLGDDNRYETFTDDSFADASCTLKVMDTAYASYFGDWSRFWDTFQEGDFYSLDRVIKVYTLTFDEYIYLKSILAANNDIEFMTEPVIYAGNVSGGLGFVTAITPSAYTIQFPPEPYTGEPPYFAYKYRDPVPDDYYYE